MKIYMQCCEPCVHASLHITGTCLHNAFAICDVRTRVILRWGQPWRLQSPNDTTVVTIPACRCPLGGKQTFSHDEKSCKKSQRLSKVHLRLFTQPCSALYPVASYRHSSYQSVVVSAMQPCGHTVIQRCELALGWWPDVTASLIISTSLVPRYTLGVAAEDICWLRVWL